MCIEQAHSTHLYDWGQGNAGHSESDTSLGDFVTEHRL